MNQTVKKRVSAIIIFNKRSPPRQCMAPAYEYHQLLVIQTKLPRPWALTSLFFFSTLLSEFQEFILKRRNVRNEKHGWISYLAYYDQGQSSLLVILNKECLENDVDSYFETKGGSYYSFIIPDHILDLRICWRMCWGILIETDTKWILSFPKKSNALFLWRTNHQFLSTCTIDPGDFCAIDAAGSCGLGSGRGVSTAWILHEIKHRIVPWQDHG